MIRLRVLVEGETEEDFINEILKKELAIKGIYATANHLGLSRNNKGIVSWQNASRYILNSLKEDPKIVVTTFVDYYGLKPDWPGWEQASQAIYDKRSAIFREAINLELQEKLGERWNPKRFLPFVMIHEFEALLFADPTSAAQGMSVPKLEKPMTAILENFPSPEAINDSPETAPSKRLEKLFQQHNLGRYDKRLHGNLAALEMGLTTLRQHCPQFGAWIDQLEQLNTAD